VRTVTVVQDGSIGDINTSNADSRRAEVWGALFDSSRLDRVCKVHGVAFDNRYGA